MVHAHSPIPPQNESSVEPLRGLVLKLRRQAVEIAAVHQRLKECRYTGSYSSVRRFVSRLEAVQPEVVARVETKAGEETQVDFGHAGPMPDDHGALRKAWAFVMTLSSSQHQYVEFVFDQKVETWVRLQRNAGCGQGVGTGLGQPCALCGYMGPAEGCPA